MPSIAPRGEKLGGREVRCMTCLGMTPGRTRVGPAMNSRATYEGARSANGLTRRRFPRDDDA